MAAAAALATPGFYFHSAVLLFPAIRLAWEDELAPRWGTRVRRWLDRAPEPAGV